MQIKTKIYIILWKNEVKQVKYFSHMSLIKMYICGLFGSKVIHIKYLKHFLHCLPSDSTLTYLS